MFSLPTAYLIVGVMYLVMPTVAWAVLSGLRSRSALLWCAGSALFGVGVVLLGLRPHITEWVAYPLANGLMLLANLVRVQALQHELQRPAWPQKWLIWLGIGFVLGYECLRLGLDQATLRFLWSSSILTASFLYISRLAWQLGRQEDSRSAYWVAGAYLAVGSMLVLRTVAVASGFSQPNALFGGWDSVLSVGSALISSVVGSVGFIGIFLERARHNDLLAAAARAQQEERDRLGMQIAQLDRQRCLGEMSASLGHELNQPLTAILLDAQMGQHGLAQNQLDTAQLQELLHDIESNTQRASQIIERIRSFIRPMPERHQPVELGQLVQEVAQLLAYEARQCEAAFVFELPPVPVWVRGDAIQLSQIVLNVYRNAVQAMTEQPQPHQITVTITVALDTVLLRICDTGPGLTLEAIVQAGQAFFSTKADGLGLGLSISRAIAQRHAGTLHIANHPQGGAVVKLRLPMAKSI
jgi:signal transduction histidine kinase